MRIYSSEQQIGVAAKRKMNMLNRALARGDITQEGYDLLVHDVDAWVNGECHKLKERIANNGRSKDYHQ